MNRIFTAIQNIVKRAYVSRSEPDTKDASLVQVSYFKKTGIAEVISPYGLCSRLPVNLQVVLFAVQGQENNRACIGYSQHDRLKNLAEGEVALFNPQTKTFIKLDKDGNIDIDCKAKIVINAASDVELTNVGKLTINSTGDIDITTSGKVDLKSTGDVDIDAPQVNLGTGGAAIARVGDDVNLTTGKIITGGTNTSI